MRRKTWGFDGCTRFFFGFFGPSANANHCFAFINFLEQGRRIVNGDRLLEREADVARKTRVARSPRYRNSHRRLGSARDNLLYLALDQITSEMRCVTAMRFPRPAAVPNFRSPIVVRTCWEQWKKSPLVVLNQRSGKGHAQRTVFLRIF
jgi:hypothetical protein